MSATSIAWVETPEPALNCAFAHIRDHWSDLVRPGEWLAMPLPHPYVRPGGFFKMFVYWDAYFTLLGLVVQSRWELATGIVNNMVYAVERLGHVPGYVSSKTVCTSRSQSPYLTSAISEVAAFVADRDWLARAAAAAEREYLEYWTVEPHLTGTGLSRYVDTGPDGCVTVPDTPHHRAMAESGWDNTGRFGDDATAVIPVDLNAQLFRYELDLASFADVLDRPRAAAEWSPARSRTPAYSSSGTTSWIPPGRPRDATHPNPGSAGPMACSPPCSPGSCSGYAPANRHRGRPAFQAGLAGRFGPAFPDIPGPAAAVSRHNPGGQTGAA